MQEHHPIVGSPTGSWIAARMTDLPLGFHTSISLGSNLLSFHSRRSLSFSVIHVVFGLPGPRSPSICMSQTAFIAPLNRSTCTNQQLKAFFFSGLQQRDQSQVEPTAFLTTSGFTLQICLIMALSLHCKRCRYGLVKGQVSLT